MSDLGLWSCIGTNVKLGRLEGLNKKGRFLSPSTSLDTIVTVEIETLSKPSHFYFWQSKRSCCTCKAPRGSMWRSDRALQRADEGHNSNDGTTVYTECGYGAESVLPLAWSQEEGRRCWTRRRSGRSSSCCTAVLKADRSAAEGRCRRWLWKS